MTTKESNAYKLEFQPIILKALVLDCDINQAEIGEILGVSRPLVNLLLNRGYMPKRVLNPRKKIEDALRQIPHATGWLIQKGLSLDDVWKPLGRSLRWHYSSGQRKRNQAAARHAVTSTRSQNVSDDHTPKLEVQMISQEALKHFRLFRNPFIDDVQKDSDVFTSAEHDYIFSSMVEAGRHHGWIAVIGEVGSGKTTIRKKVQEQLRKDGDVLIIFPQIVDKKKITASSISDAIIMDISDEKPKINIEQKARQVQRLLTDRSRNGYRCCLIIEESHDLTTQALKYLKRYYEMEDGYNRLLGIILIGQTELKEMFNEAYHVEMREVIRRVQVAEIRGMDNEIKEYLALKFRRIGAKVEDIVTDDAIVALSSRLTTKDKQGRKISHAYPLMINNFTAKAMSLAYEMGELKVTEEVVMAI